MSRLKKDINFRIIGVYLFTVFISLIIIFKIVQVQYFNNEINTSSQPRYFIEHATRGNIFSDNGSLLAISMPLYDIRIDFSVIDQKIFDKEKNNLSHMLANLFNDKTQKEYLAFLQTSKDKKLNKYILLKNKVSHTELNILKKMPIFNLGQNKGGLIPEKRLNRTNPFGLLAKRTIGELRSVNPVGIERAYNHILSGIDGRTLKRKIGKGIWVPQDSKGNTLPDPGHDINTTINIDMQDVAEKALEKALINHDADWGCVVMMEVKTGEVKVIANLRKDTNNIVNEWFNYATAQHIAPGSTFKLASIISGLEDGLFSLSDSINLNKGKKKYYDRLMIDSDNKYDRVTIEKAFVISSNVGISSIINSNYKNNPRKYIDRIYQMGLMTPLDLELPYPNNLIMPEPYEGGWSGVTLPWMSIGYEMQLTPIHMLTFYNAIANNGKMVNPLFVSSVSKDGIETSQFSADVINNSICSKLTIQKIIPLLEGVVNEGTAKNIKSDSYKIAGKTGTTVLNYTKREIGEKKKYQASFIGFFPSDNPKYSCIVVVNNPRKNGHYGSKVAAPIFKELSDNVYANDINIYTNKLAIIKKNQTASNIKDRLFPIVKNGSKYDAKVVLEKLDVPADVTDGKWMIAQSNSKAVKLLLRNIEKDFKNYKMPDLRGMNLKDAVFLLQSYGLTVSSSGHGFVFRQSIKKGNKFTYGSHIHLELI
ncbi:MAG: cell division protein [Flavobacteriales bacterium]|nr:cell division protein [Flavobacteriales bacterium]